MKNHSPRLNVSRYCVGILAAALLQACAPKYSYRENAMPEPVVLSPRLQTMFAKTKLVCFGRYALEVPKEAVLLWGRIGIPVDVEVMSGGAQAQKQRLAEEIENIKRAHRTAEIIYNDVGPIAGS